MTGAINNIAGSLAGTQAQANDAVRDIRKKDEEVRRRRGIRDEYEPVVSEAETAEGVRNLKDNSQEETREDREEHGGYGSDGRPASGPGKSLDISG